MTVPSYDEYKTYFGRFYIITPFYKTLTDERTTAEVEQLIGLCRFSAADLILDHGCGQGRHVLGLRDRGYRIIGLDYSRTLLRVAGLGARKQGREASFVRADMISLPLSDSTFDWVLSLFGSFGYLDDQANMTVLDEISRILKPGGKTLLELWNKDYALRSDGRSSRHDLEDGDYLIQRYDYSPDTRRMTVTRQYFIEDREDVSSVSYRLFSVTELAGLLESSGFEIVEKLGGLDSKTLNEDCRSQVLIVRKQ